MHPIVMKQKRDTFNTGSSIIYDERDDIRENMHVVHEMKIVVVLVIGCVVLVACIVYIVSQCRRRRISNTSSSKFQRNRLASADMQILLEHQESAETLLHVGSKKTISRNEINKEFYV